MVDSIFLSPHSDDESLFGSIILQRYKPVVMVVTDSHNQYYSHGITAHERREESKAACKLLGVNVEFLGIADHRLSLYRHVMEWVIKSLSPATVIFAPALQGGHRDHDTVSRIASHMSDMRVIFYATYGNLSIIEDYKTLKPTVAEYNLKVDALRCYPSQYNIMPYFGQATQIPEERISELP